MRCVSLSGSMSLWIWLLVDDGEAVTVKLFTCNGDGTTLPLRQMSRTLITT